MSSKIFVRYGLLGSPDGFQTSYRFVDCNYTVPTDYLDSLREYAVALLPKADEEGRHRQPILCLQRNIVENQSKNLNSTSMSMFFSTNQIGANREGTFYGSFVEVFNGSFSNKINIIQSIINELYRLADGQLGEYVNKSTNTYIKRLNDTPAPQAEELDSLVKNEKFVPFSISEYGVDALLPSNISISLDVKKRQSSSARTLIVECTKDNLTSAIDFLLRAKTLNLYGRIFIVLDKISVQKVHASPIQPKPDILDFNNHDFTDIVFGFQRVQEESYQQFHSYFQAFQNSNDERLKAIEAQAKKAIDLVNQEKNNIVHKNKELNDELLRKENLLQSTDIASKKLVEIMGIVSSPSTDLEGIQGTYITNQDLANRVSDELSMLNNTVKSTIGSNLNQFMERTGHQLRKTNKQLSITTKLQIFSAVLFFALLVLVGFFGYKKIISPLNSQQDVLMKFTETIQKQDSKLYDLERSVVTINESFKQIKQRETQTSNSVIEKVNANTKNK